MITYKMQQRARKIANRVRMPYTWETVANRLLVKESLWPKKKND